MNALSISNTLIHQDDQSRYCLNDLHKAAGNNSKHQPANFLRLDSAKELVEEINRSSDMMNAIEVKQGGKQQGTYVAKELVYAYAMWISPAFSLKVIRTFDALITGQLQPTLPSNDYAVLQSKYITLLEQENSRLKHQPVPAAAQTFFGTIRAWTPEEDALVRTLKAQGLGNTRIGLKLGRTGDSVSCHLRYMAKRQGGAA